MAATDTHTQNARHRWGFVSGIDRVEGAVEADVDIGSNLDPFDEVGIGRPHRRACPTVAAGAALVFIGVLSGFGSLTRAAGVDVSDRRRV
ncbi:hypothetical protein A8L33_00780 [Microbacterium aurantiacum]|nr:hypothetical protein A8L33_00780 [Microbacterium chocolatum]